MYRLGQSSLPTEGTGPVVNLLTREVNDVRDAVFTELERSWQTPVLAVGLAGDREDGLMAAVLLLAAFTLYFVTSLLLRSLEGKASRP